MATGSTGSSFPKWQLAILLGAPIAIGLGYLYIKNRHEDPEKKKLAEVASKKTISLDEEQSKTESPLEHATKLKASGNRAFHAGEYDEAIALYNKAIEACPPNHPTDLATYYQNRSACYEKREMWDKVKEDCTKALSLNEKYIRAFLRRSRAAEKSQDLVLALEDVTAACILEGFQVQGSLLMADRILKALGKQHAKEAITFKKPTMPSKHFIKTYFSSFSQDPIINSLSTSDDLSPAKKALKNEDYDNIIQLCTVDIEDAKLSLEQKMEAKLLRGTFYLLLGQYERALKDLTDVMFEKSLPGNVRCNAAIKRASIYMQLEDVDHSQEDYEQADTMDINNSDVHHHRGQAYLLTGRVSEASDEFSTAVKLNPEFAVAYIQKCYAKYAVMKFFNNTNDLDKIYQSFETAISKFPKLSEAYILYAEVLSDQGDFSRADALFEKAIGIDPHNANVLVHRGIMLLKQNGDAEGAVKLINKAINTDKKCLFAYETLGTIEVQRQNLQQAIILFEKAIDLARTEPEMTHLFALKDAASAQLKVSERWGLNLSTFTPT